MCQRLQASIPSAAYSIHTRRLPAHTRWLHPSPKPSIFSSSCLPRPCPDCPSRPSPRTGSTGATGRSRRPSRARQALTSTQAEPLRTCARLRRHIPRCRACWPPCWPCRPPPPPPSFSPPPPRRVPRDPSPLLPARCGSAPGLAGHACSALLAWCVTAERLWQGQTQLYSVSVYRIMIH